MTDHERVISAIYRPRVQAIEKAIHQHYGTTPSGIRSRNRNKEVREPRQVLQYELRRICPLMPLAMIGSYTGNGKPWNHATIIHSCNKVLEDMTAKTKKGNYINPEFREHILSLEAKIDILILREKDPDMVRRLNRRRVKLHHRAAGFRAKHYRVICKDSKL
jgi:hypothetical protein